VWETLYNCGKASSSENLFLGYLSYLTLMLGMIMLINSLPVGVMSRSLKIALIVGTILNVINQPGVFFGDAKLDIVKAILTYIVPFCVSMYGAITALKAQRSR